MFFFIRDDTRPSIFQSIHTWPYFNLSIYQILASWYESEGLQIDRCLEEINQKIKVRQ